MAHSLHICSESNVIRLTYGNIITYDEIGNPLSDGTWSYTWQHGRQLASMSNGTTTWNFSYNSDGLRTQKTNGTKTYSYVYNGSSLSQMTVGKDTLRFFYDASGLPVSVEYNGTAYFYATNVQGDVTAILDATGVAVVEYTYDAWGKPLTMTGDSTLGTVNPLRYRGYVYDRETGLYYLQSRYYNPVIGRFINADGYSSTGQGLLGNNMFAYCGNNPVMYYDPAGNIPWIIGPLGPLVIYIFTGLLGSQDTEKPPADYIENNSHSHNCYSYAFNLSKKANPGDFSRTATSDYMFRDNNMYTTQEITDFILRDMAVLGKAVRVVDSPTDKLSNEYIVAMKTSTKLVPNMNFADYHFAVQLSDGTWADKPGATPSRWNELDGMASAWDLGNIKNYYNTQTVYFAVEG